MLLKFSYPLVYLTVIQFLQTSTNTLEQIYAHEVKKTECNLYTQILYLLMLAKPFDSLSLKKIWKRDDNPTMTYYGGDTMS